MGIFWGKEFKPSAYTISHGTRIRPAAINYPKKVLLTTKNNYMCPFCETMVFSRYSLVEGSTYYCSRGNLEEGGRGEGCGKYFFV